MKKRRLKPIVYVIVAALIMFFVAIGASRYFKKPEEVVIEEGTPIPEESMPAEENIPAEESNTPAEESKPTEETNITVIENQGDIEIVIPEGMESDGF